MSFEKQLRAGILLGTIFLSGCVGEMQGVVRGTGQQVKMSFEQGMESDTLVATIGDEVFKGKSVPANSQSFFANGFGGGGLFGEVSSSKFVATLLGSKGSTMRCDLNYADSSGFTASGGVGLCQHSNGRLVDVVW